MKRIVMSVLVLLMAVWALANDGVYYVNGNHLVPVQESDIAVTKEVLTIDIGDDGYAHVDVYYELTNRGKAKTVDMGFEASMPYNSGDTFNKKGRHPYIKGFSATMNGEKLTYRTGVVRASEEKPTNFKTIDTNKWKPVDLEEWDMGNTVLTDGKGHRASIAYAYFFKANFKAGKNTVHHTYRYKMSYGVYRAFEIPYWLTPAMRWANKQIDDFTLRISATNTAKHFFVPNELFSSSPFKVVKGKGKVRKVKIEDYGTVTEVTLRDGMVEWHSKNFRPERDMIIKSADQMIGTDKTRDMGYFYDRGGYIPWCIVNFAEFYGREPKNEAEERTLKLRIMRNLPYADRGYVFSDQQLQKYFGSKWWYMPDPEWKMSTDRFTSFDWKFVNNPEQFIPE